MATEVGSNTKMSLEVGRYSQNGDQSWEVLPSLQFSDNQLGSMCHHNNPKTILLHKKIMIHRYHRCSIL